MQVKNKAKLKDKNVAITLVPEDSEDLWYLYNLLKKGDTVQLVTHRNVKKETKLKSQRGKAKWKRLWLD